MGKRLSVKGCNVTRRKSCTHGATDHRLPQEKPVMVKNPWLRAVPSDSHRSILEAVTSLSVWGYATDGMLSVMSDL